MVSCGVAVGADRAVDARRDLARGQVARDVDARHRDQVAGHLAGDADLGVDVPERRGEGAAERQRHPLAVLERGDGGGEIDRPGGQPAGEAPAERQLLAVVGPAEIVARVVVEELLVVEVDRAAQHGVDLEPQADAGAAPLLVGEGRIVGAAVLDAGEAGGERDAQGGAAAQLQPGVEPVAQPRAGPPHGVDLVDDQVVVEVDRDGVEEIDLVAAQRGIDPERGVGHRAAVVEREGRARQPAGRVLASVVVAQLGIARQRQGLDLRGPPQEQVEAEERRRWSTPRHRARDRGCPRR